MSWPQGWGSYRVPARWGLVAVLSCVVALPLVVPVQAQESGCYTQVARVALHDDSGFLNIPASINGHTTRMIVDTGSEGSLLSPEAAALFETQRDKAVRTVVQGTGGVGHIVPNAIVTSFRVGKAQLGPVSVPVSALPATPRTEPAVEGLIGGDMLSGYDVEFNVAQGWLALWRADAPDCTGPVGWRYIYRAVPLMVTDHHRALARLELDGHPLWALVDSGARSRIVSETAAIRVGVPESTLQTDPGGLTQGVDGHSQQYHWHRFHRLQIGQEREEAPVLTIMTLKDTADMLLGADWFATHRVWISYRTHTLYVMPSQRGGGQGGL